MQDANGSTADYGARPVSVDLARVHSLRETRVWAAVPSRGRPRSLPLTDAVAADRLSLAHWPPGHRIIVCSLTGGSGRTTMAGLVADVLAELPYAHVHKPVALVEPDARPLSTARRRWGVHAPGPDGTGGKGANEDADPSRSALVVLDTLPYENTGPDHSTVVIDAPAGLPSEFDFARSHPAASFLWITRPDSDSLADSAEALVRLEKGSRGDRRRVCVAINLGVGSLDRRGKAAASALGIRCAAVHMLPRSSALGPCGALPSGSAIPRPVRRVVTRLCLDLWIGTQR